MRRETIFTNSASGRGAQSSELKLMFPGPGVEWVELSHGIDIVRLLKQSVAKGCDSAIAAGGDGTVNALVNALMAIDTERRPDLGVVPLGTANDFARTLGIPTEIRAAADLIRSAQPVAMDVVQIRGAGNNRYFANIAAGGNCVRVSEVMTDEMKARWGAFCYIRGAVEVLADMTCYRIVAEFDEEESVELDCWAVLVANGRTNAGGIEVAPRASIKDGKIDVVIIRDGTVADMVEIVASNLWGDFLQTSQIIFRQVSLLRLQSSPPMRFTLDGEVVDDEPVEFNVVPAAIKVFAGNLWEIAKK